MTRFSKRSLQSTAKINGESPKPQLGSMLSMFFVLAGLVSPLFLSARLQSSAKLVGMNGRIHLLRNQNGPRYFYSPFSFHGLIMHF